MKMKKIIPIVALSLIMVGAITVTEKRQEIADIQVTQNCVDVAKSYQDVADTQTDLMLVDSTAYYDKYHYGYGADGRGLVEGLTLAGKREWLGMSAILYDTDMNFIGIYEFRDTGYGQSTGQGTSKLLKNKSIGTIENGTCIDVYFDTYADCKVWGRRKVYMKLIKAAG